MLMKPWPPLNRKYNRAFRKWLETVRRDRAPRASVTGWFEKWGYTMTKELLRDLNGKNNGAFRRWLDAFNGEPRIAWYPSAGKDFRDLMYLHPGFAKVSPALLPEPPPPDIFLHTDYFPWSESTFLDTRSVYIDDRTSVVVETIEELPRCDLPLDAQIVDLPKGSEATGRVIFLELKVRSDLLGEFSAPVIYAFVENAAFCAQRILPSASHISHIVHVRFGGGPMGGGKSTGVWLLNTLLPLHCEVFVSDDHFARQSGDERVYELYPSLAGKEDRASLRPLRHMRGEEWSNHGDVTWYRTGEHQPERRV